MLFDPADLFGQTRRLTLYNNVASVGENTGRLTATLRISPTPAIQWELEQLGMAW